MKSLYCINSVLRIWTLSVSKCGDISFFWCVKMFMLSFFRVSKGVRELPGNFQTATSNIPSGKSLLYFSLLLATGVFFVFMSFTLFLPVIVLVPQKFAICFTLGCGLIIGSFFALRGPKNQFSHMSSKEVVFSWIFYFLFLNL